MRHLGQIDHKDSLQRFTAFLEAEDIRYKAEESGESFAIWILEEDDLERALKAFEHFQKFPDDPMFTDLEKSIANLRITKKTAPLIVKPPSQRGQRQNRTTRIRPSRNVTAASFKGITFMLLLICIFSFLRDSVEQFSQETQRVTTSTQRMMLYDYPEALRIRDRLKVAYEKSLSQDSDLAEQEIADLAKALPQKKVWPGLYPLFLEAAKEGKANSKFWEYDAPLFEKISEGQIWRLFTPIFLHGNLLHLLFNMLWLLVLAGQIEERLGKNRYLLFIFLTATLSNTAQYLISGYSFVGFSGVICAMAGFIWMRQQRAAWEGYSMQPGTLMLLSLAIGVFVLITTISFVMELLAYSGLAIGIANTAHVVGGLSGAALGRLNFFSWKRGS
ncbi:MAG: hypothetical protein CMO81_03525 [Waddliaceae bacterium]|nr:hypothetical protein [Waddliaceae bacterium]